MPIYTKDQLLKVGSNQNVQINEEGGKIYTFAKNSTYELKNDISFEYNGIWTMPTLDASGKIEGQDKQIKIKDTSKGTETYYYYTSQNNFKSPLTKDGAAYK